MTKESIRKALSGKWTEEQINSILGAIDQVPDDLGIIDRGIALIEEVKSWLTEYHSLSDMQQKVIRHAIYTKHGGYGRAFTSMFEAWKATADKIGH